MSKPVVAGPRSAASGAGPAEARPGGSRWAGWRPAWSAPAARAVRATIVVPGLFALTLKVIADPQMALFAVFGGFATLVMTSFGGTRRDKAVAHLGLATAGSIALVIGTAVSGTPWLAAIVTIPVTFAIFFAGVAGPNAASGVTAALLAYVLPVASAGGVATIGSRLEGWWLASAAATAAVLLLSPRSAGDRLRTAAGATAAAVAATLRAVAETGGGPAAQDAREASASAKYDLLAAFTAAPYRPTGLAVADQALASLVQVLEWCASLASDLVDCRPDIRHAAPADRELLVTTVGLLRDCASLLAGQHAVPDLHSLESARAASAAHQREPCHGGPDAASGCTRVSFYAQVISVAARSATADTLIATRRASPELVAAQRRTWYGPPARDGAGRRWPARLAALPGGLAILGGNASLRSAWFRNAARGAIALAAAVAVADMLDIQHGFWVVLGTLSVLRTSAASTGASAWRALAGTVAVLFNLLVPVGWTVGLLRVQDVALGCAVSLIVGALFWPRGAASMVGDDLSDAFRSGGSYLTQAVDWALGLRRKRPDAGPATVTAGIRLDDALRAYLAEQGSKRLPKEDLWRLVMATMRIRLTANSLAGLHGRAGGASGASGAGSGEGDPASSGLRQLTVELAGFYERVAVQVGRPGREQPDALRQLAALGAPAGQEDGLAGQRGLVSVPTAAHPRTVWVREHLRQLRQHADSITAPAARLAGLRRIPWWR